MLIVYKMLYLQIKYCIGYFIVLTCLGGIGLVPKLVVV